MLFGGSAAAGLAAKGPGACQGLLRGICSLLGGLSCFLIFWFFFHCLFLTVPHDGMPHREVLDVFLYPLLELLGLDAAASLRRQRRGWHYKF